MINRPAANSPSEVSEMEGPIVGNQFLSRETDRILAARSSACATPDDVSSKVDASWS